MKKSMALVASAAAALTLMLAGCSGTTDDGNSSDPIHQAATVLSDEYGESVSYEQVKSVTDNALSETGNPVNDEYRSKAWSSVLAALKDPKLSAVDPMDVMSCVADGDAGAGMTLPQMAAFCAVSLM